MERLGTGKTLALGFQHIAVMYGGAVAVPIIVAGALGLTQAQLVYLISFDLLACGLATLLQVMGGKHIGIKLPALMAVSFINVEPAIAIGKIHGITGVFGAVIVAGLLVALCAPFIGRLVRFFPPIVSGSVILIIGISLMPVAMNNAAGGAGSKTFGDPKHLLIALFTLLCFLLFNTMFKGFIKVISILLAMVIGTIVASFFGMVNFNVFLEAKWFNVPQPFYFGVPTFDTSSIITMTIITFIIAIESIGVFFALGDITGRDIKSDDIKRGLRAEGLGGFISGFLNSFNHSTFSQNVGLVLLTKVTNLRVLTAAGGILIVLGLVPKVGALTTMIPPAVLGGAMVPMFGMLISAALKIIAKEDLASPANQLIVAVGVGIGLAIKGVPGAFVDLPSTARLLLGNGVVMGSLVLVVLNMILNGTSSKASHAGHGIENAELAAAEESH
ncbi:nucleobase:cation symporter-2 family protein [Neobacillus sp. SAB-20_R2A]|uniref:nucleobase:cation symporter-2 family protein n=1 Tax=Neobacillus sp. SAB-20_R2A TaxID=3120519 RepID=UPI003C6E0382